MEGITTQFLEENPAGLSPEMIYLKKRETFAWVLSNREEIERYAHAFVYKTAYTMEDALHIAYCAAVDAVDLWVKKNGQMNYKHCFMSVYKFQLMELRRLRTVTMEKLPEGVVVAAAARKPAPDYGLSVPGFLEAMGKLSKRQRQVAEWVVYGDWKSKKEFAEKLGINKKTLNRHIQEAILKLRNKK